MRYLPVVFTRRRIIWNKVSDCSIVLFRTSLKCCSASFLSFFFRPNHVVNCAIFIYPFYFLKHFFLFIDQNETRFGGQKYIDVRKYELDQKTDVLKPSKLGIKIGANLLFNFKMDLENYLDITDRLFERSSKSFNSVKIYSTEKDFVSVKLLHNVCYGHENDHPSQVQHMEKGGCLEEKPWEDVDEFFGEAIGGFRSEDVTRLATATSKRLRENIIP